ncbi:MAG: TIGR03087 family PEP-CTERM/XrtA system glycosyltransferase [Pseudomonadota bacterium]
MSEILFLAHRVPFPPNRGDKIRSHHLLRKLASLAPVHVGCFSESAEDRESVHALAEVSASHCVVPRTKPLVLAGAEAVLTGKPVSLTAFQSARLDRWVRQTIADRPISAIVVFSGQMGQYIPDDFPGRAIIDLCDVDSAKFEGYADAGERVWLNAREGRLLALEEQRLAERCDATILISQAEAGLFRSRLKDNKSARIEVIGNGIDANLFNSRSVKAHEELSAESGPHFVFTGQMDYRPNEAAALWAIEHFLPKAQERFPNAQFHIVGRAPTSALLRHQDKPGVRIWGEVADVRPFLAGATCVVTPLQIARGVQNKVLEAMAMARPVLLTPQAATGIAARDGEHWMVENPNPDGMMARLEVLMVDPGFAERMGWAAREFVLANHDWDATLAPLAHLVGSDLTEEKRDAA